MDQFEKDGGMQEPENAPEIEVTEIRSDAPETPPENKKKKPRRWMYIVGAVVLILVIGLITYAIWERPPEVAAPVPKTDQTDKPAAPDNPAKSEDPAADEPDPGEAPAVEFTSERKPGVYTMLVVGRDHASNSTDTILLASFDTVTHKINVVNIPRDTLINISWSTTPKKINAVYPGFVNSGKDGLEGLRAQVKNLLGFDVDCYAVCTLEALVYSVDAIGGVYFDVPQDMDYDDAPQYLHVHLKKGYQLLNGYQTMGVFRFRHGYAGGDLDRIKVQQDLMKAIASQMLSLGNIPNMGEIIDILLENIDTNLSAANIAWFARQFLSCSMDDITFETLPYSAAPVINGVSFVSPDTTKWLQLINESLNPFKDDVTLSNVNILTCNGNYVSATNGVVAGGPDSFYCLTCTVKNGGKAVHHAPGACPKDEPPEEETPETPEDPSETPVPGEEVPVEPETPAEGGETSAETPQIEVVTVPADPEPAAEPVA